GMVVSYLSLVLRRFVLLVLLCLLVFFFFFSSRRRHTRCYRDWSSDVCSSDPSGARRHHRVIWIDGGAVRRNGPTHEVVSAYESRSEERRVGKGCRSQWGQDDGKVNE